MDDTAVRWREDARDVIGEDREGEVCGESVRGGVVEREADEEEERHIGQRIQVEGNKGCPSLRTRWRKEVLLRLWWRRGGVNCRGDLRWATGDTDLGGVLGTGGDGDGFIDC